MWLLSKNCADEMYYKSYKKIYEKMANRAKILYFNTQFDAKTNSIKQIWSNLNKVCSARKAKKSHNVINKLLKEDGSEILDPNEICNVFNDYFCSVGTNLINSLPAASQCFTAFLDSSVRDSIVVDNVDVNELLFLIDSLKCGKSCGFDGISPQLIKDNKYLLCEPLAYLFNLSLASGIVPDNLKIAKVIPIYKKGKESTTSNYRPISLLSIFNKLLKKLVYKRLYAFLLRNNVLYEYQFGFRKNHSTSMALLEVVDSCYKHLDDSNKVVGVYFDLQKAFDTVDHKILLAKLYNYGIRGPMHSWLQNYLHNRKQFTVVNSVSSNMGNVVCGVPQGSVLGPLFS